MNIVCKDQGETEQKFFDSFLARDKKVFILFDGSMFHYNNIRFFFLCLKQLATPVGLTPSTGIIFKIGKLIDIMKVERDPGLPLSRTLRCIVISIIRDV